MPEESNVEQVRARFGATAERVAEHAGEQVELVREQLRSFVAPRGDERALDVGEALLERARAGAPANVSFVEGDATALPFEPFSFDLVCTRRTLHHIARPELVVAELARVTAPAGRIFVDDQIAPVDPL